MDEKWCNRLKECREKKGYSLKDLEAFEMLGISQQSIIKYEHGEVFPKIDILEKMCSLYETTIDYVLYGNNKFAKYESKSNSLLVIFLMLFSNKLEFSQANSSLIIKDEDLFRKIRIINQYKNNVDISTSEDFIKLLQGIKMLNEEK